MREPANDAPYRLIDDVEFGHDVVVSPFTNLYGCTIGDDTRVGPFVEIQRGAAIGARCKIQSHSFICAGVRIEDEVFVGHGTLFINDKFPRATTDEGIPKAENDWDPAEGRPDRAPPAADRRPSPGHGVPCRPGADPGQVGRRTFREPAAGCRPLPDHQRGVAPLDFKLLPPAPIRRSTWPCGS